MPTEILTFGSRDQALASPYFADLVSHLQSKTDKQRGVVCKGLLGIIEKGGKVSVRREMNTGTLGNIIVETGENRAEAA